MLPASHPHSRPTPLIVVGIIVVLVAPSFALLFRLARSGRLGEAEAAREHRS
jgi:hypothetical protein